MKIKYESKRSFLLRNGTRLSVSKFRIVSTKSLWSLWRLRANVEVIPYATLSSRQESVWNKKWKWNSKDSVKIDGSKNKRILREIKILVQKIKCTWITDKIIILSSHWRLRFVQPTTVSDKNGSIRHYIYVYMYIKQKKKKKREIRKKE